MQRRRSSGCQSERGSKRGKGKSSRGEGKQLDGVGKEIGKGKKGSRVGKEAALIMAFRESAERGEEGLRLPGGGDGLTKKGLDGSRLAKRSRP